MENLLLEKQGTALFIRYGGEITIEVTAELKQSIEKVLAGDAVRAVIMDLSATRFMDSSGIGFLVALNTRVQNSGKTFHLYKPSQQVKKTLELVQLIGFFEIAETEDALAAILPG